MTRRIGTALAVLVIVGTVLVAAGLGQKHPPHKLAISAAAETREVSAVNHGTAQAKDGELLFSSHGCGDCHTLAAGDYKGRLGPRLDVQAQGDPAKAVLGSIVTPPTDDPGYEAHLMPENYGSRLSSHDLGALAAFIHAAASAAKGRGSSGSS
jgi:mono/diheme cytochrome c family protein